MIYVYDIETGKNIFCAVFKEVTSGKIHTFEISSRKNQFNEMLSLLRGSRLIGFNNVDFDYPVIHWMIKNYKKYNNGFEYHIHIQANKVINSTYSSIKPSEVLIPQLDLYRIWHFNNKAKATSLKALEIAMRMDRIVDLPYDFNEDIPIEFFDNVIDYCINDVEATYKFYNESKSEIKLRCDLSAEYGLDLYNANDPKIGEEIFLHELSKEMGIDKYSLRQMRSPTNELIFKNYILDYVSFETKELKDLLYTFKEFKTTNTKGEFNYTAKIGDFEIDYAQGGLHGCIAPGIYESNEDVIIVDLDVASFYPNLAIVNNIRPKHLGDSFSKIYKDMFERRKTYPKSDPRNYGLKISLNGAFGKMNDVNSFLYDPEALLGITLNGQLLLSMLIEKIHLTYKIRLLQGNTDGFTFMCNKDDLKGIEELVKKWEEFTQLTMEYAFYKKMIIRDVNNYAAIYDSGKIKYKGCFEINRAWHKNHSMVIVSKALSEFFIKGIPVKTTIDNCTDILDFCKRGKSQSDSYLILRNSLGDTKLQKNNRYYVSKTGGEIIKIMPPLLNEDGTLKADKLNNYRKKEPRQIDLFHFIDDVIVEKDRETNLESGYYCTLLNELKDEQYHLSQINKDYYINECYKIINVVLNLE